MESVVSGKTPIRKGGVFAAPWGSQRAGQAPPPVPGTLPYTSCPSTSLISSLLVCMIPSGGCASCPVVSCRVLMPAHLRSLLSTVLLCGALGRVWSPFLSSVNVLGLDCCRHLSGCAAQCSPGAAAGVPHGSPMMPKPCSSLSALVSPAQSRCLRNRVQKACI